MHVVMLANPKLTQLDLTGLYEVPARFPGKSIDLVWKTLEAVDDAFGLRPCGREEQKIVIRTAFRLSSDQAHSSSNPCRMLLSADGFSNGT